MSIIYIVVIVSIGLIALVGTLIAGRQVDKTIEALDNVQLEEQDKRLRDHHFSDTKHNFRVLTWIYVITFLTAIIGAFVYIAFFR